MPAVKQSRQILAGYPVLNARDAVAGVNIKADYLVPSGGLALNDVIEMCGLAEGLIINDANVVCEDLDTGAAVVLDCGIVTGVYGDASTTTRACGNEIFAASTIGQAGGRQAMNKSAAALIPPSLDIVSVGVRIVTAPTGNIVGARIRLNVEAAPAPVSV